MFGHDDSKKNDNVNEPQHDSAVDTSAPPSDDQNSPAYIMSSPALPSDDSKPDTPPTPEDPAPRAEPAADIVPATDSADGDLIGIKQSALQQLTPLVGHLNQTPEEKFRTTMMMIQASDDQSLIKDAYAAAQAISDEKTKAQALLDIINEINYFTQQG